MRPFVISITIIIAGLVAYSSVFTVDETELAIVTSFGKLEKVISEPGFYLKKPGFISNIDRFDKRMQQLNTQTIQLLLNDKKPIIAGCFVIWNIKDPVLYYQSLETGENARQKLSDMVNSQLGIVFSDYDISQIINTDPRKVKLDEIESRITGAANKSASERYGIEVKHIGIVRLAYPAVVMKSVYERMETEREMEAEQIRAEGREDAGKIIAEANRTSAKIKAEADKQALVIRGEAEKETLKIYADAYSRDPEYFEFSRSLEMYEKLINRDSTLILSTKSELMRHLFRDAQKQNQDDE
ncbi:MAG: protease modulator HflC [Gammaproteobacteria bacterium]|nr:MAG: protease modulator HflC [Gammaproteobacteria bacterium]